MRKEGFGGIFPYLVTPVDQAGRLKEKVLADLVDHLIEKGVHGLTPLGSTGEVAYLDWPTKKNVVDVVVKVTRGRVPVVAGVSNMSTEGAIREAVQTEELGVDGLLVVLPSYFALGDKEVIAHFTAVARAVSCPVTLYTNPRLASWDFTIDALKQLVDVPNIRYLKDASGDTGKLMSIIVALEDRIKIFCASAHVPVFVFMLGGVGWMSGPACLIPEHSVALFEMSREKRWEEAMVLQKKLWALNVAFQKYSLAACIKAGLEMQGFDVGPPLRPKRPLDGEGRAVVRRILEEVEVL
jgi:4-hydroxy-tetrahydrodipicolinate synthase